MRHCLLLLLISFSCITATQLRQTSREYDKGLMRTPSGTAISIRWVPRTIYVDMSEDITVVADAIEMWDTAAHRSDLFRLVYETNRISRDAHGRVVLHNGEIFVYSRRTMPSRKLAGLTNTIYQAATGSIWYSRVLIHSRYRDHRFAHVLVVAHELGHCLGLDDDLVTERNHSLMQGVLRLDGEITEHDAAIIAALPHRRTPPLLSFSSLVRIAN